MVEQVTSYQGEVGEGGSVLCHDLAHVCEHERTDGSQVEVGELAERTFEHVVDPAVDSYLFQFEGCQRTGRRLVLAMPVAVVFDLQDDSAEREFPQCRPIREQCPLP